MWGQSFFGMPGVCGGWFSPLTLLLVLLLVVALLLHLFRRPGGLGSGPRGDADRDHSLEILRRKFANQEISEQEYLRMKEILER